MRKKRAAAKRVESTELVPWGGEKVDVDRFWAEAWTDLLNRQRYIARKLKITQAPWVVDQEAGIIRFERADGAFVTAPVQIIGAWNPRTSIFTWGWGNPHVQPRLRGDAERTRWFGEKHELSELTERRLRTTEQDAWRLTAVAMKVNAASGAYRGPTEGPVVFMTLGEPSVK